MLDDPNKNAVSAKYLFIGHLFSGKKRCPIDKMFHNKQKNEQNKQRPSF